MCTCGGLTNVLGNKPSSIIEINAIKDVLFDLYVNYQLVLIQKVFEEINITVYLIHMYTRKAYRLPVDLAISCNNHRKNDNTKIDGDNTIVII